MDEETLNYFYHVAKEGELDEVKRIVTQYQLKGDDLSQVVPITAGYGQLETLKYLVSEGGDLHYPENSCHSLGNASKWGRYDVAKYLLEKGLSPKTQNYYGFCHAAKNNHLKIVRLMVEKYGVDPTIRDDLPIRVAAENDSWETFWYLISHGVDLNCHDGYLVFLAVEKKNLIVLKRMVAQGAYVEDPDLLAIAGRNRDFETLKYLIKEFDLDMSYKNSVVTLYLADSRDLELIKQVLEEYPELNWETRNGLVFSRIPDEAFREQLRELVLGPRSVKSKPVEKSESEFCL